MWRENSGQRRRSTLALPPFSSCRRNPEQERGPSVPAPRGRATPAPEQATGRALLPGSSRTGAPARGGHPEGCGLRCSCRQEPPEPCVSQQPNQVCFKETNHPRQTKGSTERAPAREAPRCQLAGGVGPCPQARLSGGSPQGSAGWATLGNPHPHLPLPWCRPAHRTRASVCPWALQAPASPSSRSPGQRPSSLRRGPSNASAGPACGGPEPAALRLPPARLPSLRRPDPDILFAAVISPPPSSPTNSSTFWLHGAFMRVWEGLRHRGQLDGVSLAWALGQNPPQVENQGPRQCPQHWIPQPSARSPRRGWPLSVGDKQVADRHLGPPVSVSGVCQGALCLRQVCAGGGLYLCKLHAGGTLYLCQVCAGGWALCLCQVRAGGGGLCLCQVCAGGALCLCQMCSQGCTPLPM